MTTPLPAGPTDNRPGAVASREMVNVVKAAVTTTGGAHPRAARDDCSGDVGPCLEVLAWANNVAFAKDLWVDLYVLDTAGTLLGAESVPLRYLGPAGGGGDLFVLRTPLKLSSHGSHNQDATVVQYRVYYLVNDVVYTDGLAHTHAVTRVRLSEADSTPATPRAGARRQPDPGRRTG